MSVLVDTSIWSLALRRKHSDLSSNERLLITALRDLILEDRAQIVGPIRQEILSGIREAERFRMIMNELRDYPEPKLDVSDYEEASRMSNQCRARGISGSSTDFLICAIAQHRRWKIFTTDRDFENYRKAIPVSLYVPS